jgi:hypothetical protein
MTRSTLLAELQNRGVEPVVRDGRLKLRGPADRITSELVERARQHRAELLAHVHLARDAEISRIARLDAERREVDRPAGRSYDVDCIHPDHAEFLARTGRHCICQTPSYSIVATCKRYGVALRIDPDGTLVVGKAGAKADEATQPWSSLLTAVEAHADAMARLVEAGWHLRADFPRTAAA